jgi:hypothetical protein
VRTSTHHLDEKAFQKLDRLALQRTGRDHTVVGLGIEPVER